jgi:hypothetical protein
MIDDVERARTVSILLAIARPLLKLAEQVEKYAKLYG